MCTKQHTNTRQPFWRGASANITRRGPQCVVRVHCDYDCHRFRGAASTALRQYPFTSCLSFVYAETKWRDRCSWSVTGRGRSGEIGRNRSPTFLGNCSPSFRPSSEEPGERNAMVVYYNLQPENIVHQAKELSSVWDLVLPVFPVRQNRRRLLLHRRRVGVISPATEAERHYANDVLTKLVSFPLYELTDWLSD